MTNPGPKKVGITGGIGSGKTTATKVFRLLGIPVYYADERAKHLMSTDRTLIAQIKENFGKESYLTDNSLNRAYLAEKVFSDPNQAAKINSLVHPAVARDFETWANAQKSDYVLKEAALIFETKGHLKLDAVINVSAPIKVRIGRIKSRDPQRSMEQINDIIDKQLPDQEKNELADFVIKNYPNRMIIPQILEIHEQLITK